MRPARAAPRPRRASPCRVRPPYPFVLSMNIPFPLLLGWAVGDVLGVFLLGGLLRLVINHHCTWFINSLAHMWGRQPYTIREVMRTAEAVTPVTHLALPLAAFVMTILLLPPELKA